MSYGMGIGKPRSKLGHFLDRNGIIQEELAKVSGISRDGISRLCSGNKSVGPNESTQIKIVGALRKLGYDVRPTDFWQ